MSFRAWWQRRFAPRTAAETAASHTTGAGLTPVLDEVALDTFDPFPAPIHIEITDVIDLHTFAPRDVPRVVAEYLHEAHERGLPSVRLIHGKGQGVQRATVRRILARTSFVLDWTDAPPQAGGLGATIAHLRPKAQ